MKVSTSLFALTIASAATESQAVTCSSSDILGVTKLPQYATAMAACGTVDFSRPLDGTASICGKPTCVDALRAYAQVLPKCDVNGVSFAVNFDAALEKCKASGPAAPTAVPSTAKPVEAPTPTTKPVETPVPTTKPVEMPEPTKTTKPPVESPPPKETGSAANSTSTGSENGGRHEGDSVTTPTTTKAPTPSATTPAPVADKKSAASAMSMPLTAIVVAAVAMLSASFL